MNKIEAAQLILNALNMPLAQQNEMSALTLLVLAQISEGDAWTQAQSATMRIHDILIAMRERYQRDYAENTRETIRRQVIHQFEQAGLVLRNPDMPDLPTNSPRTHYRLSEPFLALIQQFESPTWETALAQFLDSQPALATRYQQTRERVLIPLQFQGQAFRLSPGAHNTLIVSIIQAFAPRFAPQAQLVYLGDTAAKQLIMDEGLVTQLGLGLTSHDKLPDVILYDARQNWLLLIEAVTSHGPVSPKRYTELETVFAAKGYGRIYVSAFPDLATFKSFLTQIAWETEVWIAEIPDHLIHFDGDQLLHPHH